MLIRIMMKAQDCTCLHKEFSNMLKIDVFFSSNWREMQIWNCSDKSWGKTNL